MVTFIRGWWYQMLDSIKNMPDVSFIDGKTVTDIRGEEWGFDNEKIADGADVVITFDSVGTYEYTDDIITDIVEAK